MLSRKVQCNLANAKEYFEEHLCAGDYYSQGEQVTGQWIGIGAESLGLPGNVKADEFLSLCDNLDPNTGELLTQRLKTTRTVAGDDGEAQTVANRRVFFDFTFSPPKSVSVVALVGEDARIMDAHNHAVQIAVAELERFAGTRVHSDGHISDRLTGNVVCAVFRHDTSRALDPHLHSHCIVFNATHDRTITTPPFSVRELFESIPNRTVKGGKGVTSLVSGFVGRVDAGERPSPHPGEADA